MNTDLNFSEALMLLKDGELLTRRGWNAKGLWVEIQKPDLNSKMTQPYLYLNITAGASNHYDNLQDGSDNRVPWVPGQGDLFANDWMLAGMGLQEDIDPNEPQSPA